MAEIRQQIRALAKRHNFARRLRGRPDIFGLSAHLIACQDARRSGHPDPGPPPTPQAGLPTADEIAAHLIGAAEFQMEDDTGLKIGGGVRHSLLQWSPIVQLARFDADDGRVGGRLVDELPADQPSLVRSLEVSLGLRHPDWSEPMKTGAYYDLDEVDEQAENEAEDMERAREEFAARFGFSVQGFAEWLSAFRGTDPVLYVLILSREYLLALHHCPALGDTPEDRTVPQVPGLALPPIVAAMTIGELQRLVALYRDFISNGRTTTDDVRAVIGDKALSKTKRGRRIARRIRKDGGTGRIFEHAPMWAEALRKRLFLIPGRKFSKAERNSMLASWFEGRTDWDNATSAERRHGAHELIAATLAPEIYSKSVRGRGLGFRAEPLDLYYGVPHTYLLHLGVTELGRALTGQVDRLSSIAVAARIMKVVGGSDLVPPREYARDSGIHERLHKKAVNALAVFLPPFPHRGSAGRFVAAAWLNPVRDANIFRHLLDRVRSGDPRLARGGKRGKFYLALWFLQVCFPKLYSHVRARRFGVRITCDLATSASVLTSDPILHALMLRALEATFPKAPRRKPGDPKRAPRTAFPKATKPSVAGDAILKEITRALRRNS